MHKPVLLNECIQGLNICTDGFYVDCTLGGGGHSLEICRRLSKNGKLLGIDRDRSALDRVGHIINEYPNTLIVIDNFCNIKNIFIENNLYHVDGFLLDLGVSSFQLDEAERGFSYMHDAALDMRMNQASGISAYDVVNGYSEQQLRKIISEYGEERWAGRIAKFIVHQRGQALINTTFELVGIIKKAVPKSARAEGPHPAKRTFQAIRIEVNNELNILESAVTDMVSLLNPGGRICVITFHSLEDRIIKNTFKMLANPCTCPRDLPMCVCGKEPQLEILTRKPISAGTGEINDNPRARSAKLRIAEKIGGR